MSDHSPEDAPDQYILQAAGALRSAAPGHRTRPAALAEPARPGTRLTGEQALALFDAQIGNRHLDLAARYLRAASQGLYTIGARGQRGVAGVLRPTEPGRRVRVLARNLRRLLIRERPNSHCRAGRGAETDPTSTPPSAASVSRSHRADHHRDGGTDTGRPLHASAAGPEVPIWQFATRAVSAPTAHRSS